ncbi:MAG: ricin-type beta-trefoil lectin domain protein [Gemmatimonadota bacterium]
MSRLHRIACGILGVLAIGLSVVLSPTEGAGQSGPIITQIQGSGRCVDVPYGSTTPGTPLELHDCNGQVNQTYTWTPNGELQIMGLCVDALSGLGNQGDKIGTWTCNGNAAQRWTLTAAGELRGLNNRCIDVAYGDGGNGGKLLLWDCNGQVNQRWHMASNQTVSAPPAYTPPPAPVYSAPVQPVYQAPATTTYTLSSHPVAIVTSHGRCINASGDSAIVGRCTGTGFFDITDGVISGADGGCLDGYLGEGRPVAAVGCDGSAEQKWWIHEVNGGFIQNQANSLCMDIEGQKRNNGTPIILWRCDTTWNPWNQKFIIGLSLPQGFVTGGLPRARGADITGQVSSGSASIVAAGAGNVLVAGGNIVAAGAGNIVAAGAGNVLGHNGGTIVAAGGLNLIGNDAGSLIGSDGGSIVAAGAGN